MWLLTAMFEGSEAVCFRQEYLPSYWLFYFTLTEFATEGPMQHFLSMISLPHD